MSLATSASPRPLPDVFVVTNGSNKCCRISGGTPGPLSRTQNSQRQTDRAVGVRQFQPYARPERRGKLDFAVFPRVANGFGGILNKVEENLNQLVAIAEHRRQRRIIVLGEPDMARKPGLSDPLHMIQDGVDVDALALQRPAVGESLHPIDKLHDPVGFGADQPRQRAVGIARADFKQLRRAANARQRILDLVRRAWPPCRRPTAPHRGA